jgi:hypothetical protein
MLMVVMTLCVTQLAYLLFQQLCQSRVQQQQQQQLKTLQQHCQLLQQAPRVVMTHCAIQLAYLPFQQLSQSRVQQQQQQLKTLQRQP